MTRPLAAREGNAQPLVLPGAGELRCNRDEGASSGQVESRLALRICTGQMVLRQGYCLGQSAASDAEYMLDDFRLAHDSVLEGERRRRPLRCA